jgi:DNA-binding CsgD family transcriptional regulator
MQLFPALESGGRAAAAPRGDPAELKSRLLWNFAQFLSRFAAKRPLLIALENVQWADSASLELLHFIARQIGGDRILLVCTHNDPDHRGNPMLRSTEHSLRGLGAVDRIRLDPLSEPAVAQLVERVFDGDNTSEVGAFATRLHRWTGGNPFFVEEVLKSLVENGTLRQGNGGWVGWDVDELKVPRTVRDVVLSRLSDLSPAARTLADTAAVLGARATHDALTAVSGLEPDVLVAAVDDLRRADVLREREEDGDIVYDFAHPLLQETLYAELGLARARALHGSVAEALEKYYGSTAMAHADELALHYSRSDARRLAPKAIRYLRGAGREAAAKQANREAANYLTSALALADREGEIDEMERLDLTQDLARVRQRLGDYTAALELWERLRDAAERHGLTAKLASIHRSMGLACYWSSLHQQALAHYAAGITAAQRAGEPALEAKLHIANGMCYQAIGRRAEAEREVDSAIELAERIGDTALLARVHRARLLLYVWTGPAEKAREHGTRAIELAEASGQRAVAWSGHWALAFFAGLSGDAQTMSRHLSEANRLADELRSPLLRVWTAEVEIEYGAGVGDWDHAVALAERTAAMARALGQRALLPRVLVWLGLLYFGRGEVERGKACVDEAWEISGAGGDSAAVHDVHTIVPAHIGRAAYHLTMRDLPQAIRIGERGLQIADRSGYVVWAIHRLMPVIAEAALWANDIERAKLIGARLRRDSTLLGQRLGLAWADACDALVEMLNGDATRAVELIRNAVEALEAIPFVPDAARGRRQLARALAMTGDREGAIRELRRAHEIFAHLGAQPELDATRERIRELGARPPVRSVTPGMAGLTGRELEIVRLVAARRSNKEIGQALGISARTASTHLSNIFAKLGVASRGELADAAREAGLIE